jgi:hypothetical protein
VWHSATFTHNENYFYMFLMLSLLIKDWLLSWANVRLSCSTAIKGMLNELLVQWTVRHKYTLNHIEEITMFRWYKVIAKTE